tara:strand:- start:77614 stop:77856 length:243 start_codon:yes stop_codon:yes gene_type:complete
MVFILDPPQKEKTSRWTYSTIVTGGINKNARNTTRNMLKAGRPDRARPVPDLAITTGAEAQNAKAVNRQGLEKKDISHEA